MANPSSYCRQVGVAGLTAALELSDRGTAVD
jgi:hypothetical protein